MEEQKSKFCTRDGVCIVSGLSKSVLMSNGCTKFSICTQFNEKNNKIKEKVIIIDNSSCLNKKCAKGVDKNKVDSFCLECRDFIISDKNIYLKNKIEVLLRCLVEYCFNGKNCIDISCLDCFRCRVYSDKKNKWVEFRGGKDLKGNNF